MKISSVVFNLTVCLLVAVSVKAQDAPEMLVWTESSTQGTYIIGDGQSCVVYDNSDRDVATKTITFQLPANTSGEITVTLNSNFDQFGWNTGYHSNKYDQLKVGGTTWQNNSTGTKTVTSTNGSVSIQFANNASNNSLFIFTVTAHVTSRNLYWSNILDNATYTIECGETYTITKTTSQLDKANFVTFNLPDGYTGSITIQIDSWKNMGSNGSGNNIRYDQMIANGTESGLNTNSTCATWQKNSSNLNTVDGKVTQSLVTSNTGTATLQFNDNSTGNSTFTITVHAECTQYYTILCGEEFEISKTVDDPEYTLDYSFKLPSGITGEITVELVTNNLYHNTSSGRHDSIVLHDYGNNRTGWYRHTTTSNVYQTTPAGTTFTSTSGRLGVQFHNYSTRGTSGYKLIVRATCGDLNNDTYPVLCGATETISKLYATPEGTDVKTLNFSLPEDREGTIKVTLTSDFSDLGSNARFNVNFQNLNVIEKDYDQLKVITDNETVIWQNNSVDEPRTVISETGEISVQFVNLSTRNSSYTYTVEAECDYVLVTYNTTENSECGDLSTQIATDTIYLNTSDPEHVTNTLPIYCGEGDFYFDHWSTTPGDAGTTYSSGEEFVYNTNSEEENNIDSDITLYAIYKKCEPFVASISGSNKLCIGTSTELSATHTLAGATGDAIQYMWNDDDYSTTDNLSVKPLESRTYTVTVTYKNACTAQASKTIDIIAPDAIANGLQDNDFVWTSASKGYEDNWNMSDNWIIFNQSTGKYSLAENVLPTSLNNVFVISFENCVVMDPVLKEESYAQDLTIGNDHYVDVSDQALNLAGNLINDGTLKASNGTVIFNGNTNQSIKNSQTFNNVLFNQESVNFITSLDENEPVNFTINGTAQFIKGIVDADVIFTDNSDVANANNLTYNSFVNKSVTKIGKCIFVFPTGNDFVLGAVAARLPGSESCPKVTVSYHHKDEENTDGSHGFTINEMPRWWNVADMCAQNEAKFNHISNFEYWNVNTTQELEGVTLMVSSEASAADHFTSEQYSNEYVYGAIYSNGCWLQCSPNHAVSADGMNIVLEDVTVPSVSSRAANPSFLTFASINPNVVLPIELLNFTATCDDYGALIEWSTASEKDNDYFIVEHSCDAVNFKEIARVAGAGYSNSILNYSYVDFNLLGGDNYYRLIQVDYNGSRSVSDIIVLNCNNQFQDEPAVEAYPNPFNSDLEVSLINFNNNPAKIELFDMLGKLVYYKEVDSTLNQYDVTLQLGHLSQATYTMRVCVGNSVIVKQIVKR